MSEVENVKNNDKTFIVSINNQTFIENSSFA